MTERLAEMQRAISESRDRLEALARRTAAVRERLAAPHAEAEPGPRREEPFLFDDTGPAPGVMNDLELNFEALDAEGSDREKT